MENGETIEQAVIREALEESGWQIKPTALLSIYAFTPYEGADTYHRLCIICSPIKHETNQLDPDIIESLWLSKQEIQSMPQRSPLIMQCINDYESGKSFSLEFINNMHI